MKRISFLAVLMGLLMLGQSASAQTKVPWTASQVMQPSVLAQRINAHKTGNMVLLCVGPDDMIPGSVDIGPADDDDNIEKLKTYLNRMDKNREIVIYCGCCPYDRCPNIRPAFHAVMAMGFKNAKVLDLPKNLRTNWVDKHYPVKD